MPLRLKMAVRVGGLGHRRVPELLLNPPEVGAVAQQPRRIGVPRRMVLAIGQPGLTQERLPDAFEEVTVTNDSPRGRREDEGPLVRRPVLDLALKLHRSQVVTEGR